MSDRESSEILLSGINGSCARLVVSIGDFNMEVGDPGFMGLWPLGED